MDQSIIKLIIGDRRQIWTESNDNGLWCDHKEIMTCTGVHPLICATSRVDDGEVMAWRDPSNLTNHSTAAANLHRKLHPKLISLSAFNEAASWFILFSWRNLNSIFFLTVAGGWGDISCQTHRCSRTSDNSVTLLELREEAWGKLLIQPGVTWNLQSFCAASLHGTRASRLYYYPI